MGKNSNVNKSKAYLALDLQRERELDAKRAARRARNEEKLGMSSDMAVDGDDNGVSKGKKMKKFGKVVRKKKVSISALRPSLSLAGQGGSKRKSGGIRKPSSIMKKTLKKMARKREMEMG